MGFILSDVDYKQRLIAEKKLVEDLKSQWAQMWQDRFDDKLRAEGVSVANYDFLRVERGTVIHALKDAKPLIFSEILARSMCENAERFLDADPVVGGWNKFIKKEIVGKRARERVAAEVSCAEKSGQQQLKKGGRGWLHK